MKKFISGFVLCFMISAGALFAGEFLVVKSKIIAARDSAIALIKNRDKRGAEQQKLVKDTANEVSQALDKIKPSANKEAKYNELKSTWLAFKKLREEEIIPKVLAGKQDEAEKLANGVNKERLTKMLELCDELEK
ncbi:MAG: hypothetical protein OEV66_05000 [Spirochaetia bacterium]|nr:hypothetical protein [Spirochaetia bacterium]